VKCESDIEITSAVIEINLVLWAITLSFFGGDQINCYHVEDYWKCIMIRDMKQANRRACLDEELSDEKGLSGMFMPYSLVYYKKGRLFIFLGHIIR